MDKIKILFIISFLGGGGAQRVVLNILKHIDRERFEPMLAVIKCGGDFAGAIPSDIPVFNLKSERSRFAIPSLTKLINRVNPELVFSTLNYINCLIYLVSKISKCRFKLILRSATFESIGLKRSSLLVRLLTKKAYSRADVVVATTHAMSKDLQNNFGVSTEKIRVVPNPVDLSLIQMLSRESVAHPWFQGENRKNSPIIIAIGRLVEPKGLMYLLKAFSKVRQVLKSRLVILGKGKKIEELKAYSDSLGIAQDIDFLGFKENPYKFLINADVFTLSSLWEGFPNVLVEAMACGTPVVSTDCFSGPNEIITSDVDGLLVPPADSEALAQDILRILKDGDLADKMRIASRKRAEDFDAIKMITHYEGLFRSVVVR